MLLKKWVFKHDICGDWSNIQGLGPNGAHYGNILLTVYKPEKTWKG